MAIPFSSRGRLYLFIAASIAAIALLGGGYWYFGYYTKTPTYSLQMIEEAIAAHDEQKFARYVDLDAIVDRSSDALVAGMMDANHGLTEEARAAINSFAVMFKEPLKASVKGLVREYVRTGRWGSQDSGASAAPEADALLARTGLQAIDFRQLEGVEQDPESGTATAKLRIWQEDADSEFVLRLQLERNEEGVWQAREFTNFREFIALIMDARRSQLKAYMQASEIIVNRNKGAVSEAQARLEAAQRKGSLGQTETRQAMKKIVQEEILTEWQRCKADLAALSVPAAGRTLQRLRLRICDVRIQHAEAYGEWLDTKAAATIHKANELLQEAAALEQEAEIMRRLQAKHS